jgi:hypothetical protein
MRLRNFSKMLISFNSAIAGMLSQTSVSKALPANARTLVSETVHRYAEARRESTFTESLLLNRRRAQQLLRTNDPRYFYSFEHC